MKPMTTDQRNRINIAQELAAEIDDCKTRLTKTFAQYDTAVETSDMGGVHMCMNEIDSLAGRITALKARRAHYLAGIAHFLSDSTIALR